MACSTNRFGGDIRVIDAEEVSDRVVTPCVDKEAIHGE
jgi:hypothetical protein